MLEANFQRVERDDRLLDIFPKETREKGIQLWEYWDKEHVYLLRAHLDNKKLYKIDRAEIEQALLANKRLNLSDFTPYHF